MLSSARYSASRLALSSSSSAPLIGSWSSGISHRNKTSDAILPPPRGSHLVRGIAALAIRPSLPGPSHETGGRRLLSSTASTSARANTTGVAGKTQWDLRKAHIQDAIQRIKREYRDKSRGTSEGAVHMARNAYCRASYRRRVLRKQDASEEELAEAQAAVRESWAEYQALLKDPRNAQERERYLEVERATTNKNRRLGSARDVVLVKPTRDYRVYPLCRRGAEAEAETIAMAFRARKRAYDRLRSARRAAKEPEVLAALEEALEASKAEYRKRFNDPRNAEEVEQIRAQEREKPPRKRRSKRVEEASQSSL